MGIWATMFPMAAAAKAAVNLLSRRSADRSNDNFEQVLQQTRGEQLMGQRDTDGDGMLVANEFPGDSSLFAAWDTNQDGKLTSSEIDAGLSLTRQWQVLDSDRDGLLTQHELGTTRGVFNSMDGDHDGVVSRREFHRAYSGGNVA